MNVRIDTSQLDVFANHLEVTAERAPFTARSHVRSQGELLLSGIVHRAPRETGEYAESWRLEMSTDANGNPVATAVTDHPEGFRLEQGFHGTDSLGRHFTQDDGQPHVAPAARAADDAPEQIASAVLNDL